MSEPIRVDLDDTTGCPLGERCEGCGTATGLAVGTAHAMGGVVCVTLCPACDPPRVGSATAAWMTLAHAGHLGIDLDQVAAEVQRATGPGCLWCTGRPAPDVVHGDPLCVGCYRAHRSEVSS